MTPKDIPQGNIHTVCGLLLGSREAPTDWGEFATPVSEPWSKKKANKFLLCCLLDYRLPSDRCWDNGYRLVDKILGDPENVWAEITSVSLEEWRSKHLIYKLHMYPMAHERLYRVGKKLCSIFAGDARRIWAKTSAQAALETLWDLGAGEQISRMIVGALRDCQQLKDEASDVKGDVYVRRVLGRALLGVQADAETAVQLARKLHPSDPWLLDAPIWKLGKTTCHASNPDCGNCFLAYYCAYQTRGSSPVYYGTVPEDTARSAYDAGEATETQFNREMESIFDREREIGLCSTRFIEGVRRWGGVAYARRLLDKPDGELPKNTFTFLRKKGRLDLTLEYYVVQDRFANLFSEDQRQVARWRLDHGD